MEAMHPVDEVPYEVCLDNHGCSDGPKTGRLMASNNVKLVLSRILARILVNCFIWIMYTPTFIITFVQVACLATGISGLISILS
jgi:hypothetical protein